MAKASGWGSEDRGFKSRYPDINMIKKIINFIYKYEGLIGVMGFIISFLAIYLLFKKINIFLLIPIGVVSWLSAFFIGDDVARTFKLGSIFPHRKNQTNKIRNLFIASFLMNSFSDITGSFFGRLWYYPLFNFNFAYYVLLAPLAYILFGMVLYVFYRFFKKELDYNVKHGRMSNLQASIYKIIINLELFFGSLGIITTLYYYFNFYQKFDVRWYQIYLNIQNSMNIWVFIILWLSVFFVMEYICFRLNRETLTRDIIRGDFIPLASMILASILCIFFVEFVNAPFQVWVFSHWPMDNLRFLNIPLVAYIVWPMQYLILIPLIRIFDGKNIENVW